MLYQLSYAHHRFIILYHGPNADDVSLILIPPKFRSFEFLLAPEPRQAEGPELPKLDLQAAVKPNGRELWPDVPGYCGECGCAVSRSGCKAADVSGQTKRGPDSSGPLFCLSRGTAAKKSASIPTGYPGRRLTQGRSCQLPRPV